VIRYTMDILQFQWLMTCSLLVFYVLFSLLVLLLGLYYYGNSTFTHFSRQDVLHYKSLPFLGNMGLLLMKNRSYSDYVLEVYNNIKEKPYGCLYSFQQPIIVIKDPTLIQNITTKNFHCFSDRRQVFIEGPLWKTGLPHLKGSKWTQVRAEMDKCFDLDKMKILFSTMLECCQQFSHSFEKYQQSCEEIPYVCPDDAVINVELKSLFTRFANDFIAKTIFGVKVDSLKNPRNDFFVMGRELVNFENVSSYKWLGYTTAPKFMKDFGVNLVPNKVTNYFKSLLEETISRRTSSDISNSDLLQLFIEAKEKHENNAATKVSEEDIIANALIFYFAGFDTTSTLLCLVSYEMARHPDLQSRLAEEIDNASKKNEGTFTYEIVKNLKYLEMVVCETLRLHPPVASTDRTCVARHYHLYGDPEIELRTGDSILIPIYGLHHDPKYFPNPQQFDPERFSEANRHKIHPYTYMPFGAGPRSCLGVHFALMGVKLMLINLFSKYSFHMVSKTPSPLKITHTGFNITAKGGFWLGLKERKAPS
ncbi:hypothetical protein L9F63_009044, partial [Diploptera punctata]